MSTAGSPAAEARPVQRIRAFGWRDKVGYLSGDVANNLTFSMASAFLLAVTNHITHDVASVPFLWLLPLTLYLLTFILVFSS